MQQSPPTEKDLRNCLALLDLIFKDYDGPVAIRLWNDELVVGSASAKFTLIFRYAYPMRDLLLRRDLGALVEAHFRGDVDGEGDPEVFFSLADYFNDRKLTRREQLKVLMLAAGLGKEKKTGRSKRSSAGGDRQQNSRESIAHHYDVSNDFYRLFLDEEMIYSCAYFKSPDQSINGAQQDKLDYLCRKLRLEPGHTLLDIGCGWGGLAFWAARHYGARVHGITLSNEQYKYAMERRQRLGLEKQVTFELRDYRELPDLPLYDRIISVGMFEHIGRASFPGYFDTARRLLKEGGLFLNHGITSAKNWKRSPLTRFVNQYIFPDGELSSVSTVSSAMEEARFEILDTEQLRPHYALTLRQWVKRLEENREQAIAVANEPTYRLWRLYMSGSAHYFDQGDTGLYQILACNSRQAWPLPLRRDSLYANRDKAVNELSVES